MSSVEHDPDRHPDMDGLLPEGWSSARVGDIADSLTYGYTASAAAGSHGPRFLRITDIQNGKVDWNSVPTCTIEECDIRKYGLVPGDIVFARTGATTGKSFLIKSCPLAVFASYLIRLRLLPGINPVVLEYFFQTPEYWSFISDNVAGIAQPNCNATKLSQLQVPMPPSGEQQRLVEAIETALSKVDDLAIISMANVTNGGTLLLDGLRYFPIPEGRRPALLLRRGDLLFNWRNAPKWIGKTAIFDIDGEYVNASFLLRLRPPLPEEDGRLAWLYLNHLRFQGFFNFASRAAVNQSNFNATETARIPIPLPPLSEQREILRCVGVLFKLAEKIERHLSAATVRADNLTQSILAKAFRGELVPTEAELARREGRDYEPASVLLERIRAGKANQANTPPVLKRKLRKASAHV